MASETLMHHQVLDGESVEEEEKGRQKSIILCCQRLLKRWNGCTVANTGPIGAEKNVG